MVSTKIAVVRRALLLSTLPLLETRRTMPQRLSPRLVSIALAILVAIVLALLSSQRTPIDQVIADEGTYLAMIESLKVDGDLRFTEADRLRIEAQKERGRQEIILQRGTDGRIAYSKPILFPLLSWPFAPSFGERGPIVLNAIALLLATLLALRYLRLLAQKDSQDPQLAELLMVTFLGAAVIVPYVFWRMGDSLQMALALAGLTLTLERQRLESEVDNVRPRELFGMLLLAALLTLRISNGIVAVVPILAALLARRFKRALLLGTALLLACVLFAGASQQLIGATNPYRAVRTAFLPETGYPTGIPQEELDHRFLDFRRSHITEVDTPSTLPQAAFATLYFLIGRHTGLIFYFPAAVLLLLLALRRRGDAVGWASLFAFLTTTAFFVGWKPDNYFGGETFLGNRYLISYYPLLLFVIPRLPSLRLLLLPWLIALPCYASALYSETTKGVLDQGTQSHTSRGLFAGLPIETVAQYIEGTIDRYWAGQLVRFVDPYAKVNSVNFELSSDTPAAEVVLAQWEIPSGLRFVVQTDAKSATFEVADYRRQQSFEVGQDAKDQTPLGVPVNLRPSRPWRRHSFWFAQRPYYVRVLELRLLSAEATKDHPVKAVVTFFGDPFLLEQMVNYNLHRLDWPAAAEAGESAVLRASIENRGARNWEPVDTAAVTARWRFFRVKEDGSFELANESGRLPLPRAEIAVPVEVEIPVTWPQQPGTYELEVDLVLEHVAWFQERLGHPLGRRRYEVLPATRLPAEPLPSGGGAVEASH